MTNLSEARKNKRANEKKLRTARTLQEALTQVETLEAHVRAIQTLQGANGTTVIKPRRFALNKLAT